MSTTPLFASPFIPVHKWVEEYFPKLSDSGKSKIISKIKRARLARMVGGHLCFDVLAYNKQLEKEAEEIKQFVKQAQKR